MLIILLSLPNDSLVYPVVQFIDILITLWSEYTIVFIPSFFIILIGDIHLFSSIIILSISVSSSVFVITKSIIDLLSPCSLVHSPFVHFKLFTTVSLFSIIILRNIFPPTVTSSLLPSIIVPILQLTIFVYCVLLLELVFLCFYIIYLNLLLLFYFLVGYKLPPILYLLFCYIYVSIMYQ